MEDILLQHQEKYPRMTAIDYYKLIYQHTFGVRHDLMAEEKSLNRLVDEYNQISKDLIGQQNYYEEIGNGYVRINFGAEKMDTHLLPALNKLFIATGKREEGTIEEFEGNLHVALDLSRKGKLNVSSEEIEEVIAFYKFKDYPAASHSTVYREHYAPHYRLLDKKYVPYIEAIAAIIQLEQLDEKQIIAIDGRCGSGKSTFASLIETLFDCNIFHMDDFFLPKELKTQERLNELGGNVHYERVLEQVVEPLKKEKEVKLIPFNCSINELEQAIGVPFKKLNFIEGVYSLHPELEAHYDYKIFMTVDAETQITRIRERSGEEKLHKFINEWIPLEERYFKELKIEEKAAVVIDTSVVKN